MSDIDCDERVRAVRAEVLAEVQEGVEGLGWIGLPQYAIAYAACQRDVLALLDTLSDGGPTDG